MPRTKQILIATAHEPYRPCCSKDLFAEPTAFVQNTGFQIPTSKLESGKKNDKDVRDRPGLWPRPGMPLFAPAGGVMKIGRG